VLLGGVCTDKVVRFQYGIYSAPAIIIILLLAIFGFFIFLSAVTHERRRVIGAWEITILLLLCISIYTASYAVELLRTDLAGMLLAIRFEYLGIPFLSLF